LNTLSSLAAAVAVLWLLVAAVAVALEGLELHLALQSAVALQSLLLLAVAARAALPQPAARIPSSVQSRLQVAAEPEQLQQTALQAALAAVGVQLMVVFLGLEALEPLVKEMLVAILALQAPRLAAAVVAVRAPLVESASRNQQPQAMAATVLPQVFLGHLLPMRVVVAAAFSLALPVPVGRVAVVLAR
jgi:hypothetical protein